MCNPCTCNPCKRNPGEATNPENPLKPKTLGVAPEGFLIIQMGDTGFEPVTPSV